MFSKYLFLISALALSQTSCFIKKEIPADKQDKLRVVDPKKQVFKPSDHNLTAEDFKPRPRDPKRRKHHREIIRARDHHYTIEELEKHDVLIDKEHIDHARHSHQIDMKKIKRHREKLEKEKENFAEEEKEGEIFASDDDLFEEEWEREEKPDNPDHDYLFNMIIKVHFRERFNP